MLWRATWVGLLLGAACHQSTVFAWADESEKSGASSRTEPQTENADTKKVQLTPTPTVEDRSSRATARAKGELNFDDLKFEIEKGSKFERSMLPKEIEEFHKKEIRIRGFILPQSVLKMSGFDQFVLVRDNMECCFGPGAALYDCIIVKMEPGKKADFTTRPVAVKGKFEIREFKPPGSDQHLAIYFMTASEVK